MPFTPLDTTGNSAPGENEADTTTMLRELYALGPTKPEIVALTTNTTPNATDLATAQTLANALKVTVNAIIAALKAP